MGSFRIVNFSNGVFVITLQPEIELESVDALIQRANVQFSAASSKIETASAARVPTFTVQATREMEAAIGSVTPIGMTVLVFIYFVTWITLPVCIINEQMY